MLTGGCRCGAVRYRIAVAAMPPVYACHCTICQTATGSAFSLQLPVREHAITVDGEVATSRLAGPSGAVSTHRHCARCHVRLFNTNDARPGLAIVRAGTLDGSERLVPGLHIYVSTMQPWIRVTDDVPMFAENAPMEHWMTFLRLE